MSSEVDPLLPRNRPAPEISGYGYSKRNTALGVVHDRPPPSYPNDDSHEDENDKESSSEKLTSARSALNTIFTIFIFVVLVAVIASLALPRGLSDHGGDSPPSLEPVPDRPSLPLKDRVEEILDKTPLIDGHNDLAIFLRYAYKNKIHTSKFLQDFEKGGMQMHVDLPRLKQGKVGGTFWSAFVPCPANASYDYSDRVYGQSVSTTLSQIDLIRRLQTYYPGTFTPAASNPAQALSSFYENRSLISPISIEGLHQVPQTSPFSTLRLYHKLGVRAATLTWNCHNAFADAALIPSNDTGATIPAPQYRAGLTPAGRRVIREMNRLGMLVDLSHTSYWTQQAVLSSNTTLAPVIFSHSSAFSICPHPRNVHDDILELVSATDSVVMINFTPEFISCLPPPNSSVLPDLYPKNNTLHQIARHVTYVGEKIGYEHVGLGSDFDGMLLTPKGMDGVDKFPDLVAELLKMGVSDEDASKVVGGNVLRVWKAAEKVSVTMHENGILEMEDEVSDWKESWEEMFK